LVWHASCCDEQLLKHDWLAVVLPLGRGVPVAAAELIGAVGGTTQVVWQLAAWELHVIMQLVVVEL
jgi:hypothetical protein